MILTCLDIFRDDESLYPSRSVRFSNTEVSFGAETKKIFKKFLVRGADPSFV